MLPLNAAIKHRKAKQQGERSSRRQHSVPIHVSNVMVLDPNERADASRKAHRRRQARSLRKEKRDNRFRDPQYD